MKVDSTALLGSEVALDAHVPLELTPKRTRGRSNALTRREREVLLLIACGHCIAGIAQKLETSEETVRTQSKSAYRKLCVPNAASAVASAMLQGFIAVELPEIVSVHR